MAGNYGIPCGPTQIAALTDLHQQAQQNLQAAITMITGPLADVVKELTHAVGQVQKSANLQAKKQLTQAQRQMQSALTGIATPLMGSLETATAALNTAQSMIAGGPALGVNPPAKEAHVVPDYKALLPAENPTTERSQPHATIKAPTPGTPVTGIDTSILPAGPARDMEAVPRPGAEGQVVTAQTGGGLPVDHPATFAPADMGESVIAGVTPTASKVPVTSLNTSPAPGIGVMPAVLSPTQSGPGAGVQSSAPPVQITTALAPTGPDTSDQPIDIYFKLAPPGWRFKRAGPDKVDVTTPSGKTIRLTDSEASQQLDVLAKATPAEIEAAAHPERQQYQLGAAQGPSPLDGLTPHAPAGLSRQYCAPAMTHDLQSPKSCDPDYLEPAVFANDAMTPPLSETDSPVSLGGGAGVFTPFARITVPGIGGIGFQSYKSGLSCPDLSKVFPDGLPIPGSPYFCVWAKELEAFFLELGKQVYEWIFKSTQVDITSGLSDHIESMDCTGNPFCVAIRALLRILLQVLQVVQNGVNLLVDALKCAVKLLMQLTPGGNPAAVIGIQLVRSLMGLVGKLDVGFNLGLEVVAHFGFELVKVDEYLQLLADYFCPLELPGAPEAAEAWLRGYIGAEQRDCILRANGIDPCMYAPFLMAKGEKLGPEEAIEYVRRAGGSQKDEDDALRAIGVVDPRTRAALRSLYVEVPTIAEHLHWLQRQVFDDEYVQRYHLMDGFDKFWKHFGCDLTIQGMVPKNAAYHYAAHWINPAPTQMHDFVFRLRPGRDLNPVEQSVVDFAVKQQGLSPEEARKTVDFTLEDFERLLAEQDVAPLARGWFAATAYHVPALSYVRDMFRYNVIDAARLKQYHQDLGYTDYDSEKFVGVDELVKRKLRTNEYAGWTPLSIGKAFAIGQISREDAYAKLQRLGATDSEQSDNLARAEADFRNSILRRANSQVISQTLWRIRGALRIGTIAQGDAAAAIRELGFPAAKAEAIAALGDMDRRTSLAKQGISHLRSAYLAGEITIEQVRENLANFGVVASAIDGYVSVWELQLTAGRKRRTAAQIVQDVADGMLDPADALARLANLGYTEADSMLYMADVRGKLVTLDAEATAAKLMGGRFVAEQLGNIVTETQRLSKRALGDLMRHESPGKLDSLLLGDVILTSKYIARLTLYGWECQQIVDRLELLRLKQVQNQQEKKPKVYIGTNLIGRLWTCKDGEIDETLSVDAGGPRDVADALYAGHRGERKTGQGVDNGEQVS